MDGGERSYHGYLLRSKNLCMWQNHCSPYSNYDVIGIPATCPNFLKNAENSSTLTSSVAKTRQRATFGPVGSSMGIQSTYAHQKLRHLDAYPQRSCNFKLVCVTLKKYQLRKLVLKKLEASEASKYLVRDLVSNLRRSRPKPLKSYANFRRILHFTFVCFRMRCR